MKLGTQASHIAAFVQQKSPPTYKELISYGGSSLRTRQHVVKLPRRLQESPVAS